MRVAVIGAGAAGLAAARFLTKHGADVVVLEARERVGGRVWTSDEWDGVPIDVGASWIHGTMGNPVTDLRDVFGIETVATDVESIAMYDAEGKRLGEEAQTTIHDWATGVIDRIDRPTPLRQKTDSMLTAVQAALTELDLTATFMRGVLFHLYEHFQNEWGADPEGLSARWYKDTRYEGPQEVFPGGYGQVFEQMAGELHDVRLGHRVTAVNWAGPGVSVSVAGRTAVRADCAIITLPLGVLQRGSVRFSPGPLPPEKRDAIKRLQMGVLSKTWLRFPRVFWDEDVRIHAYLGTKDGRWSSWYAFHDVTKQPVLCGLNGGRNGWDIERMPDEDIRAEAAGVLRRCFGARTPAPAAIQQSRWSTDELSLGSYSHVPPGASNDDRDTLADPLGGQLFFAGEATHRTCSQTVHGAVLSGLREARRVLTMR